MAADQHDIEQLIRDMNTAWLEGRMDDLGRFFHEGVVMAPPGGAERIVGREAMVESFRAYTQQAVTLRFDENALHVDVVDGVAVAKLSFSIRYKIGGEVYDEDGTDLYVLKRRDTGWQIAWRTQIPST